MTTYNKKQTETISNIINDHWKNDISFIKEYNNETDLNDLLFNDVFGDKNYVRYEDASIYIIMRNEFEHSSLTESIIEQVPEIEDIANEIKDLFNNYIMLMGESVRHDEVKENLFIEFLEEDPDTCLAIARCPNDRGFYKKEFLEQEIESRIDDIKSYFDDLEAPEIDDDECIEIFENYFGTPDSKYFKATLGDYFYMSDMSHEFSNGIAQVFETKKKSKLKM